MASASTTLRGLRQVGSLPRLWPTCKRPELGHLDSQAARRPTQFLLLVDVVGAQEWTTSASFQN